MGDQGDRGRSQREQRDRGQRDRSQRPLGPAGTAGRIDQPPDALRRRGPARSQGLGGRPGRGDRQQRPGQGETVLAAGSGIVGGHLHQLTDLSRRQGEEPGDPECRLQCAGEGKQQMMRPARCARSWARTASS
jgi:hypothetical protein